MEQGLAMPGDAAGEAITNLGRSDHRSPSRFAMTQTTHFFQRLCGRN
jgi:hypothetical protein